MKQSEQRRKDRYSGMRTGSRQQKYAGCEYVVVSGKNKLRLLTDVEIDELQAHVERLKNPGLQMKPKFRRSVV